MQKRQMIKNVILSVVQFLVVGIVLFILYKFLLNKLGAERFGIWSLILSTTIFYNIANLGFSASVVKFVAQSLARKDAENAIHIIETSTISIGILIGLLLFVSYPAAVWIVRIIIPASHIEDALNILPYAMLSMCISAIASIYQAGLEGHQRIDLSSWIAIFRSISYLVLCLILVPRQGLMGLAYAHVVQACMLVVLYWALLKQQLPALPAIPHRWSIRLFREMMGYGLNVQLITVSQILYDPITKGLLAKFGGLSLAGYYEMANRMILQLRGLLVAAVQVLVPTIADLKETNPDLIQKIYKETYRLVLFVAIPYFSAVIAMAPIISSMWIGHYEKSFVIFSVILSLGWFVNTLSTPCYFSDFGIGDLTWNTRGHLVIAASNIVTGLLLGFIYGGEGVVIAWALSLIAGSLTILLSFHRRNRIPYADMFPKEYLFVGLSSVAGLSSSLIAYRMLHNALGLLSLTGVVVITTVIVSALPMWQHPMRKRLMDIRLATRLAD
jgi:O-antigen/teichoic acid export membrane protein